jgi:pimeloyl-ACP methyl ester carboxylesterase
MSADSTASGDGEYTLVDVGGYRLAIHCIGESSPTVVLETGLGAPSEYWAPIQQEIAGLTRVCRFDRAGRGKSDPAPTPRTCADMVADLRALLHNASIPAPYVLVGNSLGGMNARLYAYQHPEEVAGLVLVDGSHQDQFTRSVEALPEPEPNSPDSHKGFYHFWAGGGWRDPANNPENVDFVTSREQLRAIHSLGDLPVVVLASGTFLRYPPTRPEAGPRLHEIWQDLQRDLANLSSNSVYSVVESSGHFIQRDQPEEVVDAIRRVLASAPRRSRVRLPSVRYRP